MTDRHFSASSVRPAGATAVLVLADGTAFWGQGMGAVARAVGEVVFNTGQTGYQETMSDPSYAGQILSFTFPHIGNVGANAEDMESGRPHVRGCVLRTAITEPASWRATEALDAWMRSYGLVGLCGVDTRSLTARIRDLGAPHGVIAHSPDGQFDLEALRSEASAWPGLAGMDLARDVSCRQSYEWTETGGVFGAGGGVQSAPKRRIVVVDYGVKTSILRRLALLGCQVIVVPAETSAEEILKREPDGVFLSNGPGDPAATGVYAVPTLRKLLAADKPIFGICLGHQLLALALGGKTYKMDKGHRGSNQPVLDRRSGRVAITSQNHGFAVERGTWPDDVEETHASLFDDSVEGIALKGRPVFSVQYHPEASPGPHDACGLFQRFIDCVDAARR